MSIYDVSYPTRVFVLDGPWWWKTVKGIVAESEDQARAKAVIMLRLEGLSVDVRQSVVSCREEVVTNVEEGNLG